jgi:hypothetical protein
LQNIQLNRNTSYSLSHYKFIEIDSWIWIFFLNILGDGYRYLNGTEFVYHPTARMNPFMFNPTFSGIQYALLDSRYVYHMSECRDACDRLRSGIFGRDFSGCVGFILRSPDPLMDPRPAFRTRQVCLILGRYLGQKTSSELGMDEPVLLQDANSLFGYNVMHHNNYPPLVAAFKE